MAFIGEIRTFAGNFAPKGWLLCNGATVNISDYEALFNVIRTTFGGDGQVTFAVPNLNGVVPIGSGNGYSYGQGGGSENVTLTLDQIPSHTHPFQSSTDPATSSTAFQNVVGAANVYSNGIPANPIAAATLGSSGEQQPHDNMMPDQAVTFIIAYSGAPGDMGYYLGEIRPFPYGKVPQGWAPCNGQLLPISQNAALFSLLGKIYGGDGTSNFALPNLGGSVAIGQGVSQSGTTYRPGAAGGEATVVLTIANLPPHSHTLNINAAPPNAGSPAAFAEAEMYADDAPSVVMVSLLPVGGGQAHDHMQPYATVVYAIALQGIYPEQ